MHVTDFESALPCTQQFRYEISADAGFLGNGR